MSLPWRIWVLLLTLVSCFVSVFGMQPLLGDYWWPVAGLWLAAGLASYGLSVWAAVCLLFNGVVLDLMTDAPIGAWPLAFLLAYGVGVVAWDRHPPVSRFVVEFFAVVGGLIAASGALGLAAGVAGYEGFSRAGFFTDFLITAALYPVVRYLLVPSDLREARR